MIKKLKNKVNLLNEATSQYIKQEIPKIDIGDTIKIKKMIQEGSKERIQISEGVIVAQNNANINKTITVRKTLNNVGVERVYLLHSPHILKIEIIKKSIVKRSKLYYLRNRSGKATRLKQKLD
uniref:Ribosomal protein L19 n=1 Tax=Pleurostichidium falkenbergii TaxID=121064 RepID=A0A4D6UYY8_9FLOR|nr:ribosomal protein L19 [Pleurostichidium falkenbergii]QCH39734.1 ribosomal protein L19 [Pleurostichidium falkenbergii]